MRANVLTKLVAVVAIVSSFLCQCQTVCAQTASADHTAMFPDGKSWTNIRWGGDWEYDRSRYTITGDTIVGGMKCKKAISVQLVGEYVFQNTELYLERNNVIYSVYTDEHGNLDSIILMDFNLKKGEQITWGEKSRRFYVLDEDTITVNGISRRRMIMGYPPDREITRWVEGIGESNETITRLFPSEIYYARSTFDEFTLDGEVIFTYDDFFKDSSAGLVSPVSLPPTDDGIYNLNGQRTTAPRKGEIVIKNGKKLIVK